MRVTEGKKVTDKKFYLELKEYDIEMLLRALGYYQKSLWDSNQSTLYVEKLIDKVYKAMGVKL